MARAPSLRRPTKTGFYEFLRRAHHPRADCGRHEGRGGKRKETSRVHPFVLIEQTRQLMKRAILPGRADAAP